MLVLTIVPPALVEVEQLVRSTQLITAVGRGEPMLRWVCGTASLFSAGWAIAMSLGWLIRAARSKSGAHETALLACVTVCLLAMHEGLFFMVASIGNTKSLGNAAEFLMTGGASGAAWRTLALLLNRTGFQPGGIDRVVLATVLLFIALVALLTPPLPETGLG